MAIALNLTQITDKPYYKNNSSLNSTKLLATFLLTPQAQKKVNKENAMGEVSPVAGGRSCKQLPVCFAYCEEGFALPTHKLLKKLDQNFHTVFVRTKPKEPPRCGGSS